MLIWGRAICEKKHPFLGQVHQLAGNVAIPSRGPRALKATVAPSDCLLIGELYGGYTGSSLKGYTIYIIYIYICVDIVYMLVLYTCPI